MNQFDLLVRGGTIVDGTGVPPVTGDIGIRDGKVAQVGDLDGAVSKDVIDAKGLIVAPGIIDAHTHYDAQINWDPYCTSSGWCGITTVALGNCGFGYAPVRPEARERAMLMMVNTEQIPFKSQVAGLGWQWETFPQWMDHLKSLPKGVNVAQYLPMNALMVYVMGVEAAKSRPATEAERATMREMLHEAMDAGALGFSFSFLGVEGNSHVDYDNTPMPTDVMSEEEAFNLCDVLRERGDGVIQLLADMPFGAPKREFCEQLASRSRRPVLHNVSIAVPGQPEVHRDTMKWLDDCAERGLDVWTQVGTGRLWIEFNIADGANWDSIPVFRELGTHENIEDRLALIRSQEYRERLRMEYDPIKMLESGSSLEDYYLHSAGGSDKFAPHLGKQLKTIAEETKTSITDLFLDIVSESEYTAEFMFYGNITGGFDHESTAEFLRHPKVISGLSDGGAHTKFVANGHWGIDSIMKLVVETDELSLEEMHHILSARTAKALGLVGRGTLEVGSAADIMIYDKEQLTYEFGKYRKVDDFPGGEWRRVLGGIEGISYTIVNGGVTFKDGNCSDLTPGSLAS